MLTEERVANLGDLLARGIAARFDGEVALGVERDRAVVQVRRTDPQQLVVDDRDLRVDEHLAVAGAARAPRGSRPAAGRSDRHA
jgi:hypothetical protein